jgi:hypothetical protein
MPGSLLTLIAEAGAVMTGTTLSVTLTIKEQFGAAVPHALDAPTVTVVIPLLNVTPLPVPACGLAVVVAPDSV